MKQLELEDNARTDNCLAIHKITPVLRSRMVDWMIEVLTNFKCDDQTYFIAISIMDRYFRVLEIPCEISELHILGVASMFIASKYEDIYPLKMSMVYEKIGHKKITVGEIKKKERDIISALKFQLSFPTTLDFLRQFTEDLCMRGLLPSKHSPNGDEPNLSMENTPTKK
jgi:hypothetical protein